MRGSKPTGRPRQASVVSENGSRDELELRAPPSRRQIGETGHLPNSRVMTALRAPALPAQPIPGGRLRKGGEAPLRAELQGPAEEVYTGTFSPDFTDALKG